uniref:Cytochrome c oxidase subunit 3 n=1 Tax=Polyplax spinulosa TaxID=468197 RepID=V9PXG5_9NEOP|nr:cytochrome c oxidase subunit 3 [Polyplax spinulosa]
MKTKFHPFHILDNSPWPVIMSLNILSVASLLSSSFFWGVSLLLIVPVLGLLFSVSLWWRDVVAESLFQGNHTKEVVSGLRAGVLMFILSEVMFFFSIFFAFFFISLSPDVSVGMEYPPVGVGSLNIFSVPLLNTIILLSSGVSLTWSHHSLLEKNLFNSNLGLLISISLGSWFLFLQNKEYLDCPFDISDSVFGSLFFMGTGFHGLHVLIGTIFLLISLIRSMMGHFSPCHCLGFEASAWYWHFVDVVWLFLFVTVYWWGM